MSTKNLPPLDTVSSAAQGLTSAGQAQRDELTLIYEVTLITPMYGGGVHAGEPDTAVPFRTKGIKGHLRWWWRAMARAGDFDDLFEPESAPSKMNAEQFRDLERCTWGMLDADRPASSRVTLEVVEVVGFEKFPYEERGKVKKWNPKSQQHYLKDDWIRDKSVDKLEYAYWPAQHESGIAPKWLIKKGAGFTLKLRVIATGDSKADTKLLKLVSRVVDVWGTFGGIGGRTRRGAGAVEVFQFTADSSEGSLCCAWNDTPLACLPYVTVGPGSVDALDSHRAAISVMKEFRQGPGVGRNGRMGRSHWPEPDSLRRLAGPGNWDPNHAPVHAGATHFPRAVFGMPLTIRFKSPSDPSRTLVPKGEGSERWPSPVIIRPVAVPVGDGSLTYRPMIAVLRRATAASDPDLWPQEVQVRMVGSGDAVACNQPTWNKAWVVGNENGVQKVVPLGLAKAPDPRSQPATDVVMAFFHFASGKFISWKRQQK